MTTKKLSTLIREGAQLRPQVFGSAVSLLDGHIDENGKLDEDGPCEYGTCALGAAYEAITGQLPDNTDPFETTVAFIQDSTDSIGAEIAYPDGTSLSTYVDQTVDVVVSLNDYYKWTREQIADYLEQQGQ